VNALATELDLGIGKRWLVINRAPAAVDPAVEAVAKEAGLPIPLTLPQDEAIARADITSASLLDLPDDSPAAAGVADLLRRLSA
jgi:CO dehydrogenase nickel-insertion accessory protein CooC1